MLDNRMRRELLTKARQSGFPGSILDVYSAYEQGRDLIAEYEQQQKVQQTQQMSDLAAQQSGMMQQAPSMPEQQLPQMPSFPPSVKANIPQAPESTTQNLVSSEQSQPVGMSTSKQGPRGGQLLLAKGGFKKDPPNQGLSSMGAENRLYTYKDDAAWFDNRSTYSDNSKYSDQIRHAVYSGNYGYNPVTGVLEKLPTNKRTNVSTETQRRLAEGENKQAYQKSIVDAGFNPETFAKPTAEEEKALEDRRIKDYVIKGHELAINNPVFKAGAYLTPAGMAVGAVEGAANFLPDVYNFAENPSWGGAGKVGMDALLAAPIARQLFSNARAPQLYKYNPWAFKPNPDAAYRMIGNEAGGYADAVHSGVFRPNPTGNYNATFYNAGAPYERYGSMAASGEGPQFVAEVPMSNQKLQPRFEGDAFRVTRNDHVGINEPGVRVLKQNWLYGYKPVKIGSPKNTPKPIYPGVKNYNFVTDLKQGGFLPKAQVGIGIQNAMESKAKGGFKGDPEKPKKKNILYVESKNDPAYKKYLRDLAYYNKQKAIYDNSTKPKQYQTYDDLVGQAYKNAEYYKEKFDPNIGLEYVHIGQPNDRAFAFRKPTPVIYQEPLKLEPKGIFALPTPKPLPIIQKTLLEPPVLPPSPYGVTDLGGNIGMIRKDNGVVGYVPLDKFFGTQKQLGNFYNDPKKSTREGYTLSRSDFDEWSGNVPIRGNVGDVQWDIYDDNEKEYRDRVHKSKMAKGGFEECYTCNRNRLKRYSK